MTPYEVLGVLPEASPAEITAAYRIIVQIYHPDRFFGCSEGVRHEAERRMQQVNEAYAVLRHDTHARAAAARAAAWRDTRGTARSTPHHAPHAPSGGVPWEEAARSRADQAIKANAARAAAYRAVPNADARGEAKTARFPHKLSGLGEALHTNNIRCHRCNSVQWLPDGWRERLADTVYVCSLCDTLLLCR